jgi:hypothetical protein
MKFFCDYHIGQMKKAAGTGLDRNTGRSSALALWRSFSGLSFSDRLNVGLFALTVIAIVISIWSVHIAIVTLEEAREGGSRQQQTLDASKDSLNAARASLEASAKILQDQESIQKTTLENVRSEVNLLDSINSEPHARGFLALKISCKSSGDPDDKPQKSGELVGDTESRRFHRSKWKSEFTLHLIDDEEYSCDGEVKNLGNRIIDSFEVSAGYDRLPDIWVEQPSQERLSDIDLRPVEEVHSSREALSSNQGNTILLSGGNLRPASEDPQGDRFRFVLRIPKTAEIPNTDPIIRHGDLWSENSTRSQGFYGTLRIRISPVMVEYDYIYVYLYRERNQP